MLDETFRLRKEFAIKIQDETIGRLENGEYTLVLATFGDWQAHLCEERRDLDPIEIEKQHRRVLEEFLCINHSEAMAIKPTDRLIEDLQLE
ncbi:MAG: hypothetical protein AAF085_03500 [Planctomycetota bacterium]